MIPARVYHYRDPATVLLGLQELSKRGLTPRGVLFIALDPRGETHIAVPDDFDAVMRVRVGEKLTLKPPWEGRYYHFDAVHRLIGGMVLWNGDRRLEGTGSASEVACAVSVWLKGHSARSVFLGCTPHEPGSWWTAGERSTVIDLHAAGYDSTLVAPSGLLARRSGEPALYFLPMASLRSGDLRGGWTEVHRSGLGNILMLERRISNDTLVLSCERGLIEIDVSDVPAEVREMARVEVPSGLGVVGRLDGVGFAVTRGRPDPRGLRDVAPAILVGSPEQTLRDLRGALGAQPRRRAADR